MKNLFTFDDPQVGYRHIPNAHKGQSDAEEDIGENKGGMQKKQDDLFVRNDLPLLKEDPGSAELGRKLEL